MGIDVCFLGWPPHPFWISPQFQLNQQNLSAICSQLIKNSSIHKYIFNFSRQFSILCIILTTQSTPSSSSRLNNVLRHHFADKAIIRIVKAMVFPVVMYGYESWTIKKADSWRLSSGLMLLNCGSGEDSWESLGQQGDQTVHPKGNQPWIFIGRTDAEAEAPVLWPPDAKNQLTGKDPDAGKNWRQKQKGVTEGEMVVWHHWLNGHESEQTLANGEGQGSLVCYSTDGHKESDTTKQLNNNKKSAETKNTIYWWPPIPGSARHFACVVSSLSASLSLTISWSLPEFI